MKVTGIVTVATAVVVSVMSAGNPMAQNHPGLSLRETFELYVRSIQSSDIEALFTTVTRSDSMIFVDARGTLIDTREGYYEFHERWFAERDWEMPVELLQVDEGRDYGYVVARFHHRGRASDTVVHHVDSYFTLIFHKEDGMWKVVADLCSPIRRYQVVGDSDLEYDSDQMYLFDIIRDRRTVRKFKPTPVPREHILRILDAARYAPTAGNQQPWKFLVIEDRSKLDLLAAEALSWFVASFREHRQPPDDELESTREAVQIILADVLSAPVYVAVLVDATAPYPDYVATDGALAAGHLMVAARALGYGTGFFTTFFPEDKMKALLGIPDQYNLICFTPIGVPDAWPEVPAKKGLEEFMVLESLSE